MNTKHTIITASSVAVLSGLIFSAGIFVSEFDRYQDDLRRKAEACERSNCEHVDIINDLKLPTGKAITK